jgi:hypothetical protein
VDQGSDRTRRPAFDASSSTTIRTPHVWPLVAALESRDHRYEVIGPDLIRVRGVAADDLGWIMAGARVVVYEMVTDDPA